MTATKWKVLVSGNECVTLWRWTLLMPPWRKTWSLSLFGLSGNQVYRFGLLERNESPHRCGTATGSWTFLCSWCWTRLWSHACNTNTESHFITQQTDVFDKQKQWFQVTKRAFKMVKMFAQVGNFSSVCVWSSQELKAEALRFAVIL